MGLEATREARPAWDHQLRRIEYPDGLVVIFSIDDFAALQAIIMWAIGRVPTKLIDRLPSLGRRDPNDVREIADAIADEGYPWTANDVRRRWKPC